MNIIVDRLRLFLIIKYFNKKIEIFYLFKGKLHNFYLIIFKLLGLKVNHLTWNFLEIKNSEGFNNFFDIEFYKSYEIFRNFNYQDKFFENYYLKNILRQKLDFSNFKPLWSFYLADVISFKFLNFENKVIIYLPNSELDKYIYNYFYNKKIKIYLYKKYKFKKYILFLKNYLKLQLKKFYYLLKQYFKKSEYKLENTKICFEFAYIQNNLNNILNLSNFPKNYVFCERSLKDLNSIDKQLSDTKISKNFYYLLNPKKKLRGNIFNEITQKQKKIPIKYNNLFECLKYEEFVLEKNLWKSFFKKTNTKVYVTSYYTDYQCAAAKAISELGGCTIFIQLSFYERPGIEIIPNSDVYFYLTNKEKFNEKRIQLNNKFFIKSGFINDFNYPRFKSKADQIKDKLKKNGATKIIGFFDQGYKKDGRWNHGYEVSCKNYEFFIKKLIKYEWLGLIIKPKIAGEIRIKLKKIEKLLDKAISTNRCIIVDEGTDNHKKNFDFPPPLISSACDISIHDSLVSATAGMESIAAGNYVFFLDDTGFNNSTISKIEKKIVFNNLNTMWVEIISYLKNEKDIAGLFKNISEFINKNNENNSFNKILHFCNELNEELSSGTKNKDMILKNLINRNFN